MKSIVFVLLAIFSINPALAITPTPEANTPSTSTQEIQKIREVIQQKVKEKITANHHHRTRYQNPKIRYWYYHSNKQPRNYY